jgi:2-phospho-L-lactate guanylyltransferase
MPLLTTIVPAKRCSLAKQRLAEVLDSNERSALAKVMFHDVMSALGAVRPATHVLVVTADEELASVARTYGAEVMPDRWEEGVTRAVHEAAAIMAERRFDTAMVIPADVPLVRASELGVLLKIHSARQITIVPAESDQGTNAIIASPPTAIAYSYGPNSFFHHLEQIRGAGMIAQIMQMPGLTLDVDRPSDLVRILQSDRQTRTKAFLSSLDLGRFSKLCVPIDAAQASQLDSFAGAAGNKSK